MGQKNNILSLDAGGIKGIYSVLALKKVEELYRVSFNSNFDYYVGTSIGAVIVTALADDIKIDVILKTFIRLKNDLDKGHVYLIKKLFEWIEEVFEDRRLSSIQSKIFIPSYDVSRKKNSFFNNDLHKDLKISEVLKAACSDLRIVEAHKIHNNLYADGGFFAYDPIMFFLRHNSSLLNTNINIFSVGSGIIKNAMTDLNKGNVFDSMYDSLIYEQFMTTKFFFQNLKKNQQLNYMRLSEFSNKFDEEFNPQNLFELIENRLAKLTESDFKYYI